LPGKIFLNRKTKTAKRQIQINGIAQELCGGLNIFIIPKKINPEITMQIAQ